MQNSLVPSDAERIKIMKMKLNMPVDKPAQYKRLPKVTRAAAIKSKTMNGRIGEIAGIYMPRSAHRRVGTQQSKVTGVSGGGLVNLPAFEDR